MDVPWHLLLSRAESRDGVFTVAEAEAVGIAAHQLWHRRKTGHLEFVHPGVLRVIGAAPEWIQRVHAAALWLGPSTAIAYFTAGRLLHLDGEYGDDVHAWVLNECEQGRHGGAVRVHRTQFLPDQHRLFVDGIPCTTAARTIVDLAAVTDYTALVTAAESARRLGMMTISELERTMDACGKRRRGRVALRRYIDVHTGSPVLNHKLEIKTAALLRGAGLTGFQAQFEIRLPDRRRVWVDFAFPDQRVVIECDGFRWHGDHAAWKHDRRRIAALERAGWRVINLTWDDVTRHRAETVERIRIALHRDEWCWRSK